MMQLENQIALISNPQEFTRLCNACLKSVYGDDFLEIDDDRPDRGNDGYVKSEKRMFAGHCFKRLHNQSIDQEIQSKMLGDLAKAGLLKQSGDWPLEAWTFICNYPIPEKVARAVLAKGADLGLDVSWRGPGFLAEVLQFRPEVRTRFPALEVNEVIERLSNLMTGPAQDLPTSGEWEILDNYTVPTDQELAQIAKDRETGWEYRYFGGMLRRYRGDLTTKLLDHEIEYAPSRGSLLTTQEAIRELNGSLTEASRIVSSIGRLFSRETQDLSFGKPGEHGSVTRIRHLAKRTVGCAEELLDWAAALNGLRVPEDTREIFAAAAHLADRPIAEILQFIEEYSATAARIPELLASANGEQVRLKQNLTLTMDPLALNRFQEQMQSFGNRLS